MMNRSSKDEKPTVIPLVTIVDSFGEILINWENEFLAEEGFLSLRDEGWSARFGQLQEGLNLIETSVHIVLNFSVIGWADPLPLLALATTLRGFSESTQSTLDIDLGEVSPENRRRGAFLRFLAEHKFLHIFLSSTNEVNPCLTF